MSLNIIDYLGNIGISQKEVSVYVYLLSIDSALPMEIAKSTKLKRSTVYVILDLLKGKGLVREIQRGKRFAYVAEDPERLKFLLEEVKLQTEKSIQTLSAILPELKATLRRPGEPPIMKFFEGESAVQASMEELAANPKFRTELDYGVFSLELIDKLFRSKNLRQYVDFRIKNNKFYKVIYTAEEGAILPTDPTQDPIKVDGKEFPLTCDISIFEGEVRFHMLGKTIYGILIKNPELAETLTSLINLAIKGAKK